MYLHQELTHQIIAAAIEVHKNPVPGLLEAVYRSCLALELESRELKYQKEVTVPLLYKNKKIDHCFRLDFLVENKIILEQFCDYFIESWEDLFTAIGPGFKGARLVINTS